MLSEKKCKCNVSGRGITIVSYLNDSSYKRTHPPATCYPMRMLFSYISFASVIFDERQLSSEKIYLKMLKCKQDTRKVTPHRISIRCG